MKNPLKQLKGIKMTPKVIVGISVVGTILVALTTAGVITTYNNNAKLAAETQILEQTKGEKERLSAILKIEKGTSTTDQAASSSTSPDTSTTTSNSGTSSPSTSTTQNSSGTTTPSTPAPSSGSNTGSSTTTPTPSVTTSPIDNDTPQITLTNPGYWKQTVSGSFTATATASDAGGVNRVVFMIRKIGQATAVQTVVDYSAPYSAVLNVSGLPNGDGYYTVEAQVFDNAGTGNLASYRINIQN